ncbi:MAG: hypothetical protein ACRDTK_09680 [Mycobacterium sp.]
MSGYPHSVAPVNGEIEHPDGKAGDPGFVGVRRLVFRSGGFHHARQLRPTGRVFLRRDVVEQAVPAVAVPVDPLHRRVLDVVDCLERAGEKRPAPADSFGSNNPIVVSARALFRVVDAAD